MKIKILVLSVVFSLALSVCARAEDYIVKLNSEVELLEENALGMITTDKQTAEKMLSDGRAEYIVKDDEIELLDYDYNDTFFANQWGLESQEILAVKDTGLSGSGVRIAVIDSGVYKDHVDFSGANILDGYNYCAGTTDTTDLDGHGTNVTGIIAAQENNSKGIVGIAPNAEIVPLVVYQSGSGTVSDTINAMTDAVDKYGCKILNMSLGTTGTTSIKAIQEAVDYVVQKGAVIVTAVGNKGNETYYYPAGCDNVIGVGSCDSSVEVASSSERNDSVDFTAAGVGIYTLTMSGSYKSVNGTSFASPNVAGIIALLIEKDPSMTYSDILEVLKAGCVDYGDLGYDTSYGYGFVNANASLNFMNGTSGVFISPNTDGRIKIYSNEEIGVIYRFYDESGDIAGISANDYSPENNLIYAQMDYQTQSYDVLLWDNLNNMKPIEKEKE